MFEILTKCLTKEVGIYEQLDPAYQKLDNALHTCELQRL